MDISRDQDSFSPISRQGSILTLCHGGWFGISVQKYIGWNWFQLPGGLLEKSWRSTVEWFSTLVFYDDELYISINLHLFGLQLFIELRKLVA